MKTVLSVLLFLLILSCNKDEQSIGQIDEDMLANAEIMYNMETLYIENGQATARILGYKTIRYATEDGGYFKFPIGFELLGYNDSASVETRMTAGYGEGKQNRDEVIARDSVVIVNFENGNELRTDELVWNSKTHLIYGDAYVEIYTDGDTIRGTGFKAKDNVTDYSIYKPLGVIHESIQNSDTTRNEE